MQLSGELRKSLLCIDEQNFPMKILYDHQIFSLQRYGGISRYFSELVARVVSSEVSALATENEYLSELPVYRGLVLSGGRRFIGKTTLLGGVNAVYSRLKIMGMNYDILHPTYYNPYFLERIGKKPYVITVYDMAHEVYPDCFSRNDYTSEWKRATIAGAREIIAISEFTKTELMRLYGFDGSNIHVVHLASSIMGHADMSGEQVVQQGEYILFVGNRSRYKNFDLFARSMTPLLMHNDKLNVVCAGGGAFDVKEMAFIDALGLAGRFIQMNVTDNALANLYSNAGVFVFPSHYEGFGIPLLEAFSSACPAVFNSSGSLPEVAGDAGFMTDASDETSLTSAVERVLYDSTLRRSLISKGLERAAHFSWDRTAIETVRIYENIL